MFQDRNILITNNTFVMRISIITATFNSDATVQNTFNSVLRQTHADWELIVKDGGSRDNTLEICRAFQKKAGERVRIISAPDGSSMMR